ncbi:RNA polymerase sigma factor [Streptomyces avidinii]|uniref:RNA polymerase sigma factor (Sigma-70 family) n=1 Tax=Streptomyces avidinii TaxID=1895 RepID=A0ABS4LAJ0_STRAV|nr:sigma-70 family RNA polymerase sigma factor [Streptomyces avidinii]MBP2039114.1 RNA polymerase sigma factor (sigma-70 family) [Streptomyces avidinii]GGZ22949.1 RNA polymerase sigma factor [Streptomyces avidinii]
MDLLKAEFLDKLGPLLSAEAAAEAPGAGVDAADLEQAVWVRLLESGRRAPDPAEPAEPARWLRRAVRAEARLARRRARREVPYDHGRHSVDSHRRHSADGGPPAGTAAGAEPEDALMHGEENRALRSAVARLPGRCPELMKALLSPRDLTYREIAGELGISQGSLGPVRSRCLGCLRRMLAAEVAAPGLRGKER